MRTIDKLSLPLALTAALAVALAAGSVSAQVCYSRPFSRVSDPWGCAGACGRSRPHRGVDFPAPEGTPMPAIADGIVHRVPWSSCIGHVTVIQHADGMFSGYSHMSAIYVSDGERVTRGQIIGAVGHTGSCQTGPHLHLTMGTTLASYASGATIDPLAYIDSHTVCRPDRDGDGSYEGDDCDDGDASNRPGGRESCDGQDNDCDVSVDENVTRVCGSDVGECRTGIATCLEGAVWGECVGENPPRTEQCNELDDDCDGEADDSRTCDHESARDGCADSLASDWDGDGDADACMRTPAGFECAESEGPGFRRIVRGPTMDDGEGWDDPSTYTTVRMGDVDGDGAADVCAREGELWACTPMGGGDVLRRVTIPLGPQSPGSLTPEVWLTDLDGDRVADPCVRDIEGLRCLGSSVGRVTLAALSDAAGFDEPSRHGTIRFGDVTGDGRSDVCARLEAGVTCWVASARGFEQQIAGPRWSDDEGWADVIRWSTIRMADVDADGRADLCARDQAGFRCWTSDASTFDRVLRGPALSADDGWDARSQYATLRLGDIDGDGDADLCGRASDGVHCWLADRSGFDREVLGPPLTDATGWQAPERFRSLRMADVDADGRVDLCARDASGLRCWTTTTTPFDRMRVLPSWNDLAGMGDDAFGSTLVVAGGSAGRPGDASSGMRIVGTCSVTPGRSGSRAYAALAAFALGLVIARRTRRIARS